MATSSLQLLPSKGKSCFPTSWFGATFVTWFSQQNAMQVTQCDFQANPQTALSFHFSPSLISWSLKRKPGLAMGKGHMAWNWGTPTTNSETYACTHLRSACSLTINVCVNPTSNPPNSGWPPRQSSAHPQDREQLNCVISHVWGWFTG